MKNKVYLIKITYNNGFSKKFLTINAYEDFTCRMCNSNIFPKNSSDSLLDTNVFDYFKAKQHVIKRVDARTKEYKELCKKYNWFSVSDLY